MEVKALMVLAKKVAVGSWVFSQVDLGVKDEMVLANLEVPVLDQLALVAMAGMVANLVHWELES